MRFVARCLFVLFALTPFACSAAETAQYEEGKHYKRVREVQAPADAKRISVEEFFWYGCPHCYAFDPIIGAWVKSKAADVDFARVPSTLGRPDGILHAKAFYTAESLNLLDKMHSALFAGIHQHNQPLNTEAQIASVFNRNAGVMPDVVLGTLKGFAVDARYRRSEQLARNYGVTSVPVLVIGGKYTTSATMAGGYEDMLKVTDFLVAKIRKERGK
jgi:thiol:disulfide interchange protein DsbA